jgi:hypothetical protein
VAILRRRWRAHAGWQRLTGGRFEAPPAVRVDRMAADHRPGEAGGFMRMLRLDAGLLAAACALALLVGPGCATTQSTEGKRYVVVCEDKPVTGSHIGRARCYRKTQMDERGESDREQIRRAQGREVVPITETAQPSRR